jgi:hypothetical protein
MDNIKKERIKNIDCDPPKKSKKGPIMNIPVLVDYQWEKDKEKARDLFFYDVPVVPRFWREDMVANLSKIGKVFRIQVKQQCKYKSVRAQILLNENFELTRQRGAFGIG